MRTKKRMVSETETHRVITVSARSMHGFCRGCSQNVGMIPIELAAKALDISVAELRRRLANSGGHFTQAGACVWVCQAWLPQP